MNYYGINHGNQASLHFDQLAQYQPGVDRKRVQAAVDWVNKNIAGSNALGMTSDGIICGSLGCDFPIWPSQLIHQMLTGYYRTLCPEMDFSAASASV